MIMDTTIREKGTGWAIAAKLDQTRTDQITCFLAKEGPGGIWELHRGDTYIRSWMGHMTRNYALMMALDHLEEYERR